MIPLRDSTRSHSSPMVMYAIIAACVGVYLYTTALGSESAQAEFFATYGAIPAKVTADLWPEGARGLVTSMFLHGSWLHLGGNMLYLWVFGDNIEDAMGHGRFLVFYLLTGVGAALAHVLTQPTSPVPLVGASGAIAAVLGAYLVLYPRASILSLVFLGYFARVMELPAVLVLSLWFLIQVVQGLGALAIPDVTTVAWWAHIGGFVAGVVLVFVFARRRRPVFYA
ncbi:MAG: rhomboid family intramembrane serine protease [Armatimonadetes bacterium]|nr:rhomboid family intramembrane serine protease [Armatimonadota bacterium]